jgi:peptidoglycan glycosyltransferase
MVFLTLTGLGLIGAVAVIGYYQSLSRDLLDPREFETITFQEETVVYDRTGSIELARFGEERRDVATFDEIPPILLDATTAIEDKTFWENTGFDPLAIIASGIDAVRGNPRGASTITQQLVRQRLLPSDLVQDSDRTPERKLKEIIQSIRLTNAFPGEEGKQRVITAYLNQNFYGNDSYGVKAAARRYFGVEDLHDLTIAQAAILAALPQSPSSYDLVKNAVVASDGSLVVAPDSDILLRRNRILDLMAVGDRTPISGDTYDADDFLAAKADRAALTRQAQPPWIAPHFVWAVRSELAAQLCGVEASTCPALEQGGFRVITTLDTGLQAVAETWVKAAAIVPKAQDPAAAAAALGLEYADWMANLVDKDVNNGALVAIDYQTGELVAYVGSADYEATSDDPRFQPKFDVVGDGYRQPGSAFKPFNYLTGIDDGILTAATMFMDVGTDFGGEYSPTNADNLERGPVTLRRALQFSLNIPSVKALQVNGVDHVFQRAKDFGMQFRLDQTDAGLALALGVAEVRPVDLVTAYATLANAGRRVGHTTILRIQDRDRTDVVPAWAPQPVQVASPEAAAVVTSILSENTIPSVNPFWSRFRIIDGENRRPATLKTGTNNDAKDLNAYGYLAPPTAEGREAGEYALAVGVWNGNSDNTPVSTPDRPVFSIDVSTYVWQGFLTEATAGWEIRNFSRPDGMTVVSVDPLTGLLPGPDDPAIPDLFIAGTEPRLSVGPGGVCGEAILSADGIFESRFQNWLAADRDWIARAKRGPGTVGGPDGTRTSYFYNGGFRPYGATWGPLLDAGSCATPEPTCFPYPTPDESGEIPSFEVPTPVGTEVVALPCPTEEPTATPSDEPTEEPTAEPTESPPGSPGPSPSTTPGLSPSPLASPSGIINLPLPTVSIPPGP